MSGNRAFLQALKDNASKAVLAVIPHPDGTAYLWSGIGPLEYDGSTYKGAGGLASITTARRSTALRVDDVVLSLSGVDPVIAADVSSDIRNLEASTTLVALTDDFKVRGAFPIDDISLDYISDHFQEDGTVRLDLHGQAGFFSLVAISNRVWSAADHKRTYPTDVGLDLMPSTSSQDISWTRD